MNNAEENFLCDIGLSNEECDVPFDLSNTQKLINSNFSETPYYSPEETSRKLRQDTQKKISFFHLNIRSMHRNFEDLKFFLKLMRFEFTFICLTETWCSEDLKKNSNFQLENYSIVYQNRVCKDKGGGVCIYVHNSVSFKERPDLSSNTNDCESLAIEVEQTQSKNFIVSVMYRPPPGNIKKFLETVKHAFDTCRNKQIYFLGDYNVNLLQFNSSNVVKDFVNLVFEHGCLLTINKPTRVTRKSSTVIDNIITNSFLNDNLESGIIETDISDHFPVFLLHSCESNAHLYANHPDKKVIIRPYNEANLEKLRSKLLDFDWSFLYSFTDADQAYDYFFRIFFKLYDESFPKKEITVQRKKTHPWMTSGLKKSSKRKQRLYENFLRNKTVKNEQNYKRYKNNFDRVSKFAKKLFISDLLKKYQCDIKKTWNTVNDLIGKKSSQNDVLPKSVKIGDKVIHSTVEIADEFNKFFSTIGTKLAKTVPPATKSFHSFLTKVDHGIKMFDVTDTELKNAFSSLQSDKSPGIDEVMTRVVTNISSEIFKPLKYSINLSIRQGIFPEKLKIARVVPIYKDGDRTLLNNYRPISILPCFSKLYERVMHSRIYLHLKNNNVLFNQQFGFQAEHSTEHAAVLFSDHILSTFEKNEFLLSVFIDLSKAFDTVDHAILFKKLENYGIENVYSKWFQSYLTGRKQIVTGGKTLRSVSIGVPQGSILGPLLFLLYINDIANSSNILKFILFADDTTIFHSHKNIHEVFQVIKTELPKVQEWLNANKLSLNTIKTKYMLFHKPNMADDLPLRLPKIHVNNAEIEKVTSFKFLGVYFDENMTWKTHIAAVERKLSSAAGMIYRVRSFLNFHTLKLLYNSFVQSHINYANLAWASTNKTKLLRIFVKQKQISRMIFYKNRSEHSRPLLKSLNSLNIFQTNIFQTLLMMHKASNAKLPDILNGMFDPLSHKYPTRFSNDAFRQKLSSLKQSDFRISTRGPFLWNSFKNSINNPCDLSFIRYKTLLKVHLLSIVNESDYF